jgi:pimeloyl-ACP methyl ester carboxylesterase
MPTAAVNGVELCYETRGKRSDTPLLMIHGLGAQLVSWDEPFLNLLADRGRYVITFDNRDAGLSTHFDGVDVDVLAVMAAALAEGPVPDVPYTLSDLATDAAGLLDHLGLESAHVFGLSMGGMIAQTLALEQPHRVRTLTSVMSMTGDPEFGTPTPEAAASLFNVAPTDREPYIDFCVTDWAITSSPVHYDPQRTRRVAAAEYDRAFYNEGKARQLAAIFASGRRGERLREVTIPTLVIHGRSDTLITPSAAFRMVDVMTKADLLLLNDMGHDLPEPLWPVIVEAVVSHTNR